MSEISLSKLFKEQIHDQRLSKLESVKVTQSFKRAERITADLRQNGFGVDRMQITVKITNRIRVVFKIIPEEDKIIVKRILFR